MSEEPRQWRMTPALIAARRRAMEDDVWLFWKWIWAPQVMLAQGADLAAERFHRPLLYLLDGDADRLAWCLDHFESAVIDEVRRECKRYEIDWRTPEGVRALRRRLRRINNRMSRWFLKTTMALCVLLKTASVNPNESIAIASKSDKATWGFCSIIGNVMRSAEYARYFPDRLFRRIGGKFDYTTNITQEWIRMNGRRNPAQETIEARGLRAQWPGNHYSIILGDDLSGTETGDASIEQALVFLDNIDAISMPPEFPRPTRHLINGTKQGGSDDCAKLSNDPSYFTLKVRIWTKTVPYTLSNVQKDGIPTLPEFAGIDSIRAMRLSAETGPKGLIWFMRNYELSDELGMLHFTEDLLRRQKFQWVPRLVRDQQGNMQRVRMIRRYRWNEDFSPRLQEKPNKELCDCYLHCGLFNHAYVEYDPLALPRVLGVDQGLAMHGHGDPWAIACVARDPEGFLYSLRGETDRGYDGMITRIPVVFERWGGLANPPRTIGVESGGAQSISVNWMQRGDVYGDLARRIVPVPTGNVNKTLRMYHNVLSPMLVGQLYLDPEDGAMANEMLKWDGTKANPTDGMLDSLGIGCFTHSMPAHDPKADYTELMQSERAARAEIDPATGIDTSGDILDDAWQNLTLEDLFVDENYSMFGFGENE